MAEAGSVKVPVEVTMQVSERRTMPRQRNGKTAKVDITSTADGGRLRGYITTGEYEDGRLGEVFLKVAKQGSTLSGVLDSLAIVTSHALQWGVPVYDIVDALLHQRYEPFGQTDDPAVPQCTSISDYLARWLATEYCTAEERERLGLQAPMMNLENGYLS